MLFQPDSTRNGMGAQLVPGTQQLGKFAELEDPLPPLEVQKEIVAEIEGLPESHRRCPRRRRQLPPPHPHPP